MTWLDSHISQVGTLFERAFGPQADGVRSGFVSITGGMIGSIPNDAGPETGQRFEVDLLPYVHPGFQSLVCSLRIQPSLIETLTARRFDAAAEGLIDEHFSTRGFTYVDFSPGCFPIGSDYEVRGIFVRSCFLQARNGVVAPAFSQTHRCFDALFGPPAGLTRQRLSWRSPFQVVSQAHVPADPDYVGETRKPAEMLREAGMAIQDVLSDLTRIALMAVAYAKENEGTSRVEVLNPVPVGDSRSHRHGSHTRQSILSLSQLH